MTMHDIWIAVAAFFAGGLVMTIFGACLALASVKDDLDEFHREFYSEH